MEMQKVVGDRLRPADKRDPLGVEQARAKLRTACDLVEKYIAGKTWIMGDAFTMADCAAAPALFYVDKVMPLAREPQGRRRLSRAADAAAVLCARAEGGGALFQAVSAGGCGVGSTTSCRSSRESGDQLTLRFAASRE